MELIKELAALLHQMADDMDTILTGIQFLEVVEAKTKEPPKTRGGKRIPVDKGKVIALANAGWKVEEIANEVKCSAATVYRIIEGLKEEGANVQGEN